jgi:hypothetical protein
MALVAPLVFGSGLCALVYQTAWQREFRLVFGASTAASAAVVAVFMGGLGLGGLLLGPRADRHPRPLRFYAILEALTALAAAATPALVALSRRAYLGLGGTAALGRVGRRRGAAAADGARRAGADVPGRRHPRRGGARGGGRARRTAARHGRALRTSTRSAPSPGACCRRSGCSRRSARGGRCGSPPP